jgi:peptidoglycan/LPS O-acetylase OafA/YrhL
VVSSGRGLGKRAIVRGEGEVAGFAGAVPARLEPLQTLTRDHYRPHLDGLRAVAVYLVVLFHAGQSWFRGGYIGVDVFFVLSGFLVTQLLLRDLAGGGSIRLSRFYARRFRRLLPAAFVVLIVTAMVFGAIATPIEVFDSIGSFKAAFLYSTNWYFIGQATGYFAADLTTSPVLHFWSLAVEEQFYLVWPLALGSTYALTRRMGSVRQRRTIQISVAGLAVASAAWALSLQSSNPTRAYYGTDARAYQLLAGALLALAPAIIKRAAAFPRTMHAAAITGIVALILVATSWVHLAAIERGIAATFVTGFILVAIEAADGGIAQRALAARPIVYLGRISYGTYLWHLLVIIVAARSFNLSPFSMGGVACVVATALAALSAEVLEQPVRSAGALDRHRRLVIAGGLAISVVSAIVFIPRILEPSRARAPIAVASTTNGFTPVPTSLTWPRSLTYAFPGCDGRPISQCLLVSGRGARVLVIGDSHATMFVPALREIAQQEDLALFAANKGLCSWQRDWMPNPYLSWTVDPKRTAVACSRWRDDLYQRVVPTIDPDVIIAASANWEYAGNATGIFDSVRDLSRRGRKIVLIEDVPIAASLDPLKCLSAANVLEECRYVADRNLTPAELAYRQAAAADPLDILSANVDNLICPFLPICDPVVAGHIVKFDPAHLTVEFSEYVAPQLETYLKRLGAIP